MSEIPESIPVCSEADPDRQAVVLFLQELQQLRRNGQPQATAVEHEAIGALLEMLHRAVLEGAPDTLVAGHLNSAIYFCSAHFADEEELMREAGYPHLDRHAAA